MFWPQFLQIFLRSLEGNSFRSSRTVKLQAVEIEKDQSTIQFWGFWAKGHSTKESKFPFYKASENPWECF